MHLKSIGHSTFRRHARGYLEPAVIHKWRAFQESEFQYLSQSPVKIGGDMRADSPGKVAYEMSLHVI